MARFTQKTVTTASCAPNGGVVNFAIAIEANIIDIVKVKIEPSDVAGEQEFTIFTRASRASADILFSTRRWSAAQFVDPSDDGGSEFNQSFVVPYYDRGESLLLHMRMTNWHTSAKTFDVTIDYEYAASDTPGVLGAPDGLVAAATANGLQITSGVVARLNNATINQGEFRATYVAPGGLLVPQNMRTVAEGGTWVPDGTTKIQFSGTAGPGGCQYIWTSAAQGRWYYAWRLRNSVGWSRWTDGNATPLYVTQYVDTTDTSLADVGPPADWEVWIEQGPSTGTIVVHATRPKINGRNLLWWAIQIKNGSTGSWLALDNGAAPSQVIYDGSAIAHTLSADRLTISKVSGGYGGAVAGDLICMDVRGGNFDINYCQWGAVEGISGSSLTFTMPGWRPQVSANLRIKIVKPPWSWVGGGYLGDQPNHGMWPSGAENQVNGGLGMGWIYGDFSTQEFVSTPINIPTAITNPEARVWFENIYCRSDNNLTRSSGMSGGWGVFTAPRILSDFNDRSYWLPIYPTTTWGTLAFSSVTKKATMATKTTLTDHQGHSGIKSRFRLYPDASGVLQVYLKFTNVTLPVGSASNDRLALGCVMFTRMRFDQNTTGVALIVSGTDATKVVLNSPYVEYKANNPAPNYENMPYTGSTNYNRPTVGAIIELRVTIERNNVYGSHYYCVNSIEARTGGTGSYTFTRNTWPREGNNLAIDGIECFIGWIGNCRLTGATAVLDTFQLISGLGEII